MTQLEIRDVAGHELRICKTGVFVDRRVRRERAGLGDRFAQCIDTEIRCARAALPGAVIHSHADGAVICVLEVLHVTKPGRCTQTVIVTCSDFGLICALLAGFIQYDLNEVFQV